MTTQQKKKLARVIATWLVTGIMLSVFVLDIATIILANKYVDNLSIQQFTHNKSAEADRIHFLNTANSDCILVESNGKFFLVDSGEGNENPRRKTEYKGYRDEVIDYIKKVCGDRNGKVQLEFILVTHVHYDHAGNFVPIINDKDISIGKAYIKNYTDSDLTQTEINTWKNKEIYDSIINALEQNNIPIIHDIPDESLQFGDFSLKFLNTVTPEELKGTGDNANSIGVQLRKGAKSAFLAADFTKSSGLEEYYAESIGEVDLLKIGHHGYYGSSSAKFLGILKPQIAICTNYIGKIYPNVKWNLTMCAKVPILSTEHRNGIVAEFTDNEILIFENAM